MTGVNTRSRTERSRAVGSHPTTQFARKSIPTSIGPTPIRDSVIVTPSMHVVRCICLLLLAPLAAFSATGTITFESLEINCPGAICNNGEPGGPTPDVSYTFTPGGNNVIDVLSTTNLTQRFFTYTAIVTHAVSAQPDETVAIQCEGDTNVEGGGRIFLTTDSVPAGQRNRQNFALAEERVTVNLPRRDNPSLEVVYTFTCDLQAGIPQTSFAHAEVVVRQNTIVRQSIEILEVTPSGQITGQPILDPPPPPLTPGSRQEFKVRVKWEENSIVIGANFRMTFLAADGRIVGTGGASLNRLQDGELLQANEQELETFNPILIPTDSSTLTLSIEIIETSFLNGVRTETVWVTAPDVVYQVGEPSDSLSIVNPRPKSSVELLNFTKLRFLADVNYSLVSADQAEVFLELFVPGEIPRVLDFPGPPQTIGSARGGSLIDLEIPAVELLLIADEDTVLLRAVMSDPDGNVVAHSPGVAYTVDPGLCTVETAQLSEIGGLKSQQQQPCPRDYTIEHIELIQVLQDNENLMPLVAGKSTFLRLVVGASLQTSPPKSQVVVGADEEEFALRDVSRGYTILDEGGRTLFENSGARSAVPLPLSARGLAKARLSEQPEYIPEIGSLAPGIVTVKATVNLADDGVTPERDERDSTNNEATATFRLFDTDEFRVGYVVACRSGASCEPPPDAHRLIQTLVSGYGLGNIRQVIWNERVECDLKIYRFEF